MQSSPIGPTGAETEAPMIMPLKKKLNSIRTRAHLFA
jgi:hypothetical protein